MAKKPIAKGQIKKLKKNKSSYIESIKSLNKYLLEQRYNNDDYLDKIIEYHSYDSSIIKRVLSNILGFPHIIWYYNLYMNKLFDFNKIDLKIMLKSLGYLMSINNVNNGKMLFYLKSNEKKDEVKDIIKNLIKEYMFLTYEIDLNNVDLRFYYKLFKLGIITDEDMLFIDKHLNGDSTVIKSLNYVNYRDALSNIEEYDTNEEEANDHNTADTDSFIAVYSGEIQVTKSNRSECKGCELFNNQIVVFDTNVSEKEPVDIAFIGFNPSIEDSKVGKPSNEQIKDIIKSLPVNVKWIIYNIVLCYSPSKSSIKDVNSVISNCHGLSFKIFNDFQSKYIIPIGDDAKNLFQIQDKISQASGKLYQVGNYNVIPIVNPLSILKNPKMKVLFDSSVKNILNYFQGNQQENVTQDNLFITDVNKLKDLIFFDVIKLNNKIVKIFTDVNGNKKYFQEDFKYPICIKDGDWKNCSMTTESVNNICWVNDYQKSMIMKKSREILGSMSTI